MNYIGFAVKRGAGGSQFNAHIYVAVAYDKRSDSYLIVNFTTKRGMRTSVFTPEIKRSEFPTVLTSEISVVEYGKAEEVSPADFAACGFLRDSYGREKICPPQLLQRIIAQIHAGSELKNSFVRKYFPDSPILPAKK